MPTPQQQIDQAERHFQSGQVQLAESLLRQLAQDGKATSRAFELLAYICGNRGELEACEGFLEQAQALPRCSAEALFYLGRVRLQRGRTREAIDAFERSVRQAGDYFEALHELGVAHSALDEHEVALGFFERAARKNPRSPDLLANMGTSLAALQRREEALKHYEAALRLDPKMARAWADAGLALMELGRIEAAVEAYEKVMKLAPDTDYLHGRLLHGRMFLCRWAGWAELVAETVRRVDEGRAAAEPFALMSTPAGPATLLRGARTFAAENCPPRTTELPPPAYREPGRKLRVAYVSTDFRSHAVAQLIAGLFEQHDRERFEWFGYALGPREHDEMRSRIEAGLDHFTDVADHSDAEIAALAREDGIDIVVDLNGFTGTSRPGIFAHRAAPLQVNYLGFPGSMGCEFIDYIVADEVVIRPEDCAHYTEKVVVLPGAYQANDNTRRIGEAPPARETMGLPAEGFVFACFNNNHKITPDVFDVWMRLLQRVPGSVLWLLKGKEPAAWAALQAEAKARGVDPARIVDAGRAPVADHLARHAHADLFVDTFHYNAHTTCSDALWTGLPVLTLAGPTFASRVAASLLRAVGLPELVTHDVAAYEAAAFELATSPERLRALRERLRANRNTAPLFDTPRFARGIEAAYEAMWDRHRRGLAPDHLRISDDRAPQPGS
jgi:protein O-GlcNAc transferase